MGRSCGDALTVAGVFARIQTDLGTFFARYSREGLAELHFPQAQPPTSSFPSSAPHWHALTVEAVRAILGARVPVALPPLDLSGHTEFRRRVWAELIRIPLGCTASYGEIAERLGNPGATRAVGGACGANPIPLIIPCHRVLAAGHALGGFSGGLEWKRKLLGIEGVAINQPIRSRQNNLQPELFVP